MSAKKGTAVKKATAKKAFKAKAPAAAPWTITDALADERLQPSVRRALGNQSRFRTPRCVRTVMSRLYDVAHVFKVTRVNQNVLLKPKAD